MFRPPQEQLPFSLPGGGGGPAQHSVPGQPPQMNMYPLGPSIPQYSAPVQGQGPIYNAAPAYPSHMQGAPPPPNVMPGMYPLSRSYGPSSGPPPPHGMMNMGSFPNPPLPPAPTSAHGPTMHMPGRGFPMPSPYTTVAPPPAIPQMAPSPFPVLMPKPLPHPHPHPHPHPPPLFVPPLPGSPPSDVPPPPPPGPPPQSPSPPPPSPGPVECPLPEPKMPNDPEMVKNIEVLAAFVVKNGTQFESMARAKQAGDPKFAFLFETDTSTEAGIGHEYYGWRKHVLKRELEAENGGGVDKVGYEGRPSEQQPRTQSSSSEHGLPSPTASDMDMEDDFTSPLNEKLDTVQSANRGQVVETENAVQLVERVYCSDNEDSESSTPDREPSQKHTTGVDEEPLGNMPDMEGTLNRASDGGFLQRDGTPNAREHSQSSTPERATSPRIERESSSRGPTPDRDSSPSNELPKKNSTPDHELPASSSPDGKPPQSSYNADEKPAEGSYSPEDSPQRSNALNSERLELPSDVAHPESSPSMDHAMGDADDGSELDGTKATEQEEATLTAEERKRETETSSLDHEEDEDQEGIKKAMETSTLDEVEPEHGEIRSATPSPLNEDINSPRHLASPSFSQSPPFTLSESPPISPFPTKPTEPNNLGTSSNPQWTLPESNPVPSKQTVEALSQMKPADQSMPWQLPESVPQFRSDQHYLQEPPVIQQSMPVNQPPSMGNMNAPQFRQHFTPDAPPFQQSFQGAPMQNPQRPGGFYGQMQPGFSGNSLPPRANIPANNLPPFQGSFPSSLPAQPGFAHPGNHPTGYSASFPTTFLRPVTNMAPNFNMNSNVHMGLPPALSFPNDRSKHFTFPNGPQNNISLASGPPPFLPSSIDQRTTPLGIPWMNPNSSTDISSSSIPSQSGVNMRPGFPFSTTQISGSGMPQAQSMPLTVTGKPYDPLADSLESEMSSARTLAWRNSMSITTPDFQAQQPPPRNQTPEDDAQLLAKVLNSITPAVDNNMNILGPSIGHADIRPPLGVAANNQGGLKNTGAVVAMNRTLADSGVVENVSPPEEQRNWSPVLAGETGPGEVEIGQEQQAKPKSKKNKEAHGLKLLRAAVADHVKEVLKPTWKDGHMSKEAFKTIAKKAVDKVTGSLKSHQIPKSQEKVTQYMASSKEKINKLVQSYVDKYMKH